MRYWRYYLPFSLFFDLKELFEDYKHSYRFKKTLRELRKLEAQMNEEADVLAKAVQEQAKKLAEELEPEIRRRAILRRQLRRRGEHDY
jgi:hypothetical protein